MGIRIYYFSATGNSLFVAMELSRLLPNVQLIPIVQALKKEKIEDNTTIIGFVFPCHGLTIPLPVKKFLQKLDVRECSYLFAIVTRGGTVFRGFSMINRLLRKAKKPLDATFLIDMLSNDPKLAVFKVHSQEEWEAVREKTIKKIEFISEKILTQTAYHEKDEGISFTKSPLLNGFLERMIAGLVNFMDKGPNGYFYTTSKCTGCGLCEKVCLAEKIKIVDNIPVWQHDYPCFFCYACLNFCPANAIEIKDKWYMKSHTPENGRYPHPFAKFKEICDQKSSSN